MSDTSKLPEVPLWAYLQCSRNYTDFNRRYVHVVKYAIRISLDKHLRTTINRIRLVILTFQDVKDLVLKDSFLPSGTVSKALASDSKAEELQIHFRFEPERDHLRVINGSLSFCNRTALSHTPPTYTQILHNKVYALSASNPIVLIPFELATIQASNFHRQVYPNASSMNHYFIYIAKSHGFFDSRHWFPALPVNVIADIARYCLLFNKEKPSIWGSTNTLCSDVKIITNLSLISKQWTKDDILKDVLFSRIMNVSGPLRDRRGLSLAIKLLRERPSRGKGLRGIVIPTSYKIQDPKFDSGESRDSLLEELRELHGYLTDLDWVNLIHAVFAVTRKELEKLKKVDSFHVTRGEPMDWWGVNDCIVEEVLETINGWESLRMVRLEGKYKFTVGDPTKVPHELPAYRPLHLALDRLHISDVQIRHIVANPLQRLESLNLYAVRGLTSRGLREVFQLVAGCLRSLSVRNCRISSERDEIVSNGSEEFQERPLDSTMSLMPAISDVVVPFELASALSIARKREENPDLIHKRVAHIKITDYKIPYGTQSQGGVGLPEALLETGWKKVTLAFWNGGQVLEKEERCHRKHFVQLARKAADCRGVAFLTP